MRSPSEVAAIRTNLPEAPNSFVGRQREVAELLRLIRAARALTLCGPGGIGKTRLALHVLAAAVDDFPDGAWVVDLSDLRQPELVVSRMASVLGITEEPSRPLLETLADALRPRTMLVALDNCEHLIEACAQVSQRLLASAPGLRLLVTSREPLRVAAEHVWQVPPLSMAVELSGPGGDVSYQSEAIHLFADRAAASLPGFAVSAANAEAVTRLCRALDGMPLAIELAAARVRALSVEQIGARLADRFRLLTTGDRAAPARHRTLRATIDWSHDLLTEAERTLLRRLSVFAGWSLEMAEQVCSDDDLPAMDVLDAMAALVDKSLVARELEVLGQARYRLLDTIREYAAAHLEEAGESDFFRRRLRDLIVRVAEQNLATGMAQVAAPWSARVNVFRQYDAELGNVWQALTQALAAADAQAGLRICTAVSPCWIARGTFAEGAEWLDSFLALEESGVPAWVRGAALVARAQLLLSSEPVAAEASAREGLALCRTAGHDYWTAAALNLLAESALHTGRVEDAAGRADEALSVARPAGDVWHEGYALGTLAAIAAAQGRLREAGRLAQDSITAMRGIDQKWGIARALMGLGDLARLRQDPHDAHLKYREALPILREIDSRPEIARCLAGLGRVAIDRDDFAEARQYLTDSLWLSHTTGSHIGMTRALEAFAALAVREDQLERAVRLTAAASAVREGAGLPAWPGARRERLLDAARGHLDSPAVERLWLQGLALATEAAVALALQDPAAADDSLLGDPAAGPTVLDGAPAGAAGPSLGSLTPREREVVGLIARGCSNRTIAEELVISPSTAARHVANILAKLGFTSRTQVAWWAADQPSARAGAVTGPGSGEADAE
ncbi:MAG TPA: LuxR C-terminal-related transcriptional regulator [Streptosporangiaceae bacterium]|nr:LuxR C-terminal-related transcriptional regulator [Streptosporangiaceae bacterium]